MKKKHQKRRTTMTHETKYDVVVLGGGFTGCAAALAAARLGQKTLLLEASGFLGGAASNCLIFPLMPYATSVKDEDGNPKKHYLSRGILAELVRDLQETGDIRGDSGFLDEAVKLLLDRKMLEVGVQVLFHATLCGVKKDGSHIDSVDVVTKAGVLTFEGRMFIDCTGDADLCTMADVPTVLGREPDHLCQPMTLCFRVANVDKQAFFANRDEMRRLHKEWLDAGRFTNPREDILVFDYPIDGMLHFNTTRVVKHNPVDPFDVTRAEMEARRQVQELLDFFRVNKLAGMENARLVYTAPSIGVRESRMLVGDYVLTGQDLVDCTKFDDAIAAGNYDIDIHNPEGSGTSHYYFPAGTWYTIPFRSLIPKAADADNLLVGGRCISVDHEAQASVRIIPICTTTGEAAGVGAAVANREGTTVQSADVKEVQRILVESGAYIGI
ncbi:MAG: FAD-dependent oxidoreductase [Ruminococcaceae bacterium]|nr:FAD-dependent oxidoreductase [Oscillospiraceae bacterium]